MGIEVPIRALFETPTVAGLTGHLLSGTSARAALRALPRPKAVPLSFAQQRLWFLNRYEGSSATYNIPLPLRLEGSLDIPSLQAALADLLARHESLRTIFSESDGIARQSVLDVETSWTTCELRSSTAMTLPGQLSEAAIYCFDLAREIPFRATLFQLSETQHVLLLLIHHIAGDGASLAPLARDLAMAYAARCQDRAPSWAPLPVQYADYTLWQREWLGEEANPDSAIASQIDYWKRTLVDLPEQIALPTDRPHPAQASFRGDRVELEIGDKVYRQLVRVARSAHASLFMVLHAAVAVLLSKLGAGTDIPIGGAIANRTDEALDDLIGFFVNSLVLRTDVSGNPSFLELLARIRAVDLAAYSHQDLPFELLVELINPARSNARHPLFQVMVVLQNNVEATWTLPGLTLSGESLDFGNLSKFDLTFNFGELSPTDDTSGGLHFELEYATDLFDRITAEAMAERLELLLEAIAEHPDCRIDRLDVLRTSERHRLLFDCNVVEEAVAEATLPELFERQVAVAPDAIALVFEGLALTYRELNERANRLAHHLIGRGVGPEQLVAIALPRGLELVVSLLAVLKAGAAYLPLDTEYPVERLAFMLEDSRPACTLTEADFVARLPEDALPLCLDDARVMAVIAGCSSLDPGVADRLGALLAQHAAYVIYTSGSTGKPKGVVIPHQNVVRLLATTDARFGFGAEDVWTLFHSYAFDFSVWELWGALLRGGRLVVVPFLVSRSPAEFLQLLVRERVTVLNQTPSAFYQLMQADRENPELGNRLALRWVIFGGEALELARLQDWYARHRQQPTLVNMYGITETTVHVTERVLTAECVATPATQPDWSPTGRSAGLCARRLPCSRYRSA